jgi:hypothetical protein
MEPLDPGPTVQVWRAKPGTGGNRIPGMDVQIRDDIHGISIDGLLMPGKRGFFKSSILYYNHINYEMENTTSE